MAEQRPDVGGHESRVRECVGRATFLRLGPQVVPIVEDVGAAPAQLQHGAHVLRHGGPCAAHVLLLVARAQLRGLFHGQARRDVPVQGIVRGRLVGEEIGNHPAPHQLGQRLGRVHDHSDGDCFAPIPRLAGPAQRRVQRRRLLVEVALREPAAQALGIHLEPEEHRAGHRGRQRLRAAHAAEAGADH